MRRNWPGSSRRRTSGFQNVIIKYPEFARINTARYSLGLTALSPGGLAWCQKVLSEIPGPERGGELGLTSYLIADCLLRQIPNTVPDDALAAGKMEEQLKAAAENLEGFIGAWPKDPNVPDALIRYGPVPAAVGGPDRPAAGTRQDSITRPEAPTSA